ncbi:2-hydroxy-6-oxononadienedioate/2-hydroxy-6-oxononatrienedioate hydrolase [Meiothermus luteus]|jgi:pimeloyl-ACP methyl ester carboxylesterase|uniref:2-hydroxy-6-oxononadienedioate/2-hydroxy-6-oxononatrienedioate hydrolase n=1 Tax=Meiothermus luteus TaxID=2026184 RepID=A0A399EJP9_9DEIN|nr:alpha/beta hydrolase [Meiothermus luteus]RIH83886.1 2-hydroxy-6-oxononadienedioate/2-hydroxy-6-oxononatrienedioate hydrolase [Meiothermus luteus]RMH57301.1 MAG: alpha/beta fold hydrolase [Deinococcota bacterium]
MKPKFSVPETLKPYLRRTQANGVDIFLYDSGPALAEEPPFLLIHGLGDDADSWRRVFPLLMRRGRVIAPDLPGFGRSGHPRRAYTLGFFAKTLTALLERLELSQAVLVGSSMGGAVALRMTLRWPERVARLVLVGGPPMGGRPSKLQLLFLIPGQGERLYNRLRASQEAAYESLRPYYANLEALPAEERAFLRERVWDRVWSDEQRRAFFSAFRWMALERLWTPSAAQLASLDKPTQVVWGEQDGIIPAEAGQRLARLIPGARFQVIPGAGHLPHQERPEELAQLVLA